MNWGGVGGIVACSCLIWGNVPKPTRANCIVGGQIFLNGSRAHCLTIRALLGKIKTKHNDRCYQMVLHHLGVSWVANSLYVQVRKYSLVICTCFSNNFLVYYLNTTMEELNDLAVMQNDTIYGTCVHLVWFLPCVIWCRIAVVCVTTWPSHETQRWIRMAKTVINHIMPYFRRSKMP